jgi:hypothetical protein
MAKKRRRRIHSVQDLVWDMADDVKDLVRNEFEAKSGDKGRPASGSSRQTDQERESRKRAEEIGELRDAIRELAVKVTALSADQEPAGRDAPGRA